MNQRDELHRQGCQSDFKIRIEIAEQMLSVSGFKWPMMFTLRIAFTSRLLDDVDDVIFLIRTHL